MLARWNLTAQAVTGLICDAPPFLTTAASLTAQGHRSRAGDLLTLGRFGQWNIITAPAAQVKVAGSAPAIS